MKNLSLLRTLLFCTVLLFFQKSIAQSHQYYYQGEKLSLDVHRQFLNISTSSSFDENLITNLGFKSTSFQPEIAMRNNENKKQAVLEFKTIPNQIEYNSKINALKRLRGIETVSPYYSGNNNAARGTSNYFYVKLKSTTDYDKLVEVAEKRNVDIIENLSSMPQWYKLSRNENTIGENSFEVANHFYETGWFEEIDPGLIFRFRSDSKPGSGGCTYSQTNNLCVNDTEFNYQWGLYNGDYPEFDINACDSWAISKGASALIGIIDGGIDQQQPDLAGVVLDDYDCYSGPPLFLPYYNPHGTHVAGIAAALQNNNEQITGVAPEAKIVSVRYPFALAQNYIDIAFDLADGFDWAVNTKGADVVNCSWGDGGASPNMHNVVLENAIADAILNGRNGLGAVVVFATGHFGSVAYPANLFEKITTVTSIVAAGYQFGPHGDEIDLVAPGFNINSTVPGSSTECWNGTSMAAPHVTGVVAQMIDVNPCLTGQQVRNILETTAQKIFPDSTDPVTYPEVSERPNGGWNEYMGYGLVDALASASTAANSYSPTLDLTIRNSVYDFGIEPDEVSGTTDLSPGTTNRYPDIELWNSPDIWVRNQNDGINNQEHEIPDFAENPNYVYVRVTNKSCNTSSGNDILKIYWANASKGLTWPAKWDGLPINGSILGGTIAELNIPVMSPGSEIILSTIWNAPNPDNFPGEEFSILARIVSTNDPMTYPEGLSIWSNVKNNNNIGWKNTQLINGPSPLTDQGLATRNNDSKTMDDNEALGMEFDKISLYPNPVKKYLEINNLSNLKITNVRVYDSTGRLVLEQNKDFSSLDVSSFPTGIFFLTIETDQGTLTKKIVKH